MDFLTLFAIYVVVVLTCIVLVCKYSGQQQTPVSILFNAVGKVRKRAFFSCNSTTRRQVVLLDNILVCTAVSAVNFPHR